MSQLLRGPTFERLTPKVGRAVDRSNVRKRFAVDPSSDKQLQMAADQNVLPARHHRLGMTANFGAANPSSR